MLPNELLLDMLRCADYKTLVLAKLAGPRLLRLITKYGAELAHRRTFRIAFNIRYIHHIEATTLGQRRETISYEPGNKRSLAAVCRKLAGVIGPHLVEQLTFYDDWWHTSHVGVVFEAAPPLKYAECVELFSRFDSTTSGNSEALMRHFVGMKELRLYLDDEVLRQFDWTFLGREPAVFDSSNSQGVHSGVEMRMVPSKTSSATASHFRVCAAEGRWKSTSRKASFPPHSVCALSK